MDESLAAVIEEAVALLKQAGRQGHDLPTCTAVVRAAVTVLIRTSISIGGRLLFDDDPAARVRWEAMTRKIYFDGRPRITRAHREFASAVTGTGR